MTFIREYIVFLLRAWRLSFTGNAAYYAWMTVLTILAVIGGNAWLTESVAPHTRVLMEPPRMELRTPEAYDI